MKNLKIRLLFKSIIIFLLIYNVYSFIAFNKNYNFSSNNIIDHGTITKINIYDDYKILYIHGKYNVKAYYDGESVLQIGDVISFSHKKKELLQFQNFNTFKYEIYLKGHNIRNVITISDIKLIRHKKVYDLKNKLSKIVYKRKGSAYIYAFLFCDNDYINNDIQASYFNNGIGHLFCVSGFHIVFILSLIKNVIRHIIKKENIVLILLTLFSFFYLYLGSWSLPLLRGVVFYYLNFINKRFNLEISKSILFLLCLNLCLFNNISSLYLTSFWYTFIIFFFLLIGKKDNDSRGIRKMLYTSFYCFIISAPLNIYFNYNLNLLSIILCTVFSFVVCYIIYPLCLLTVLFSEFGIILQKTILFFERLNVMVSDFKCLRFIFAKPSLIVIILLYVLLFCIIFYKKRIMRFLLIILIIFLYLQPYFDKKNYVYFLDVGQGDMSVLISKNHKNITIIDTGGLQKNNNLKQNIKQFLYSLGISKINQIILTHGDFDHMGEAINLVNNFKVEKVMFNCGPYNDLEKELIKLLDKKKIKYYSCIKKLNVDKNKLYFLQTKEYDNENDNSNVIYTELNGYKFMFMGDASTTSEHEILNDYNLPDIDVLKVGHHGSKTSSSKEFINEINPKYSIISVGKNNRYGHPNKEVLSNLENSKIYRTDKDGSIMFKIKNNKLKIETCSP